MSRLVLLVNTIRYLKLKQLYYQLFYRVRKPKLKRGIRPVLREAISRWPVTSYYESPTVDGVSYRFLGETARLEGDWNSPSFSKLWLYNLHYQDALNANGAEEQAELNGRLVGGWIAGNPPLTGNGWEPYCLSLRIVNWVKFFSRSDASELKQEWLDSLALQASALEQQLEYHILANHLFANAKALVFAGVFFCGADGERWLKKGLQLLDAEVPEQFLSDGAHYERSPMYQGTLLWDIADLLTLQQVSGLPQLESRSALWSKTLAKGIGWLRAMAHPDGEISFFNDATFGIAPALDDLEAYAQRLGVELPIATVLDAVSGSLMLPSGFGVLAWPEGHRLLADVAPVGPDYQPGHAHADTLSCELSLFGQRVLVNSGISQYGEDAERHRQRSTVVHNTVCVDAQNSSEIWAGFRVARRARPFGVGIEQSLKQVQLSASHDGYRRLPGRVTHSRHWHAQPHQLVIEDKLVGTYKEAVAHWHFHPEVSVSQVDNHHFVLRLPQGESIDLFLEGGSVALLNSTWHPGFGCSIPNKKLEVNIANSSLITRIQWRAA